MKITHHKNGEIKTLVDEAPYHPGYEDVGFEPVPFAGFIKVNSELTDEEIMQTWDEVMDTLSPGNDLINFARKIIKKAQSK